MKKEVKIGIYAIVILLCAWAGIRFLSGVDVFGRHAVYYARYEQVNGVQNAAAVMIRGVKIGKVSEIRVSPDDPTSVEVVLSIPRSYRLPVDSEAKIFSTSIMGSKAIEIVLGSSSEILESGSNINSGYTKDLMAVADSELDYYKDKITTLVENFNATLKSLNSLVDNNNKSITEALAHLNSITAGLDGAIGKDKQQLADIVASIDKFTKALSENSAHIDSIMTNVDSVTSALAEKNAGKSLGESLAELNSVLAKINGGEGTVGRLMCDEQLYANLTQASANLSALLADLKEHPKRYVHFSLFGAKDEADKQNAKAAKKEAKAQKKLAKSENK
ncbi:MAG: MCE family protein [Alistipes sp.]|nr:MCE family protein [Alistipes sp.]